VSTVNPPPTLAEIRNRSTVRRDAIVAQLAERHGSKGFTGHELAQLDRYTLLCFQDELVAENKNLREALAKQYRREYSGDEARVSYAVHRAAKVQP
jgi:hypothetical protein